MSQNTETSIERKHRMMVADLCKPAADIAMTTLNKHLMHAALGIAGEGGEVVDLIKKTVINGKELDITEVIKELGDLEWYLTLLRSVLSIDRQVVLQMNIEKLRERYLDGYTDQASADRRDQATRAIDDPRQIDPDGEAYNEFVWESGGQSSDQENCLHPTLVWGGLAGYVCTVCKAPAAAVQEDIR